MSSHQVPRKRYRSSDSPNDSDEEDRTLGGALRLEVSFLDTPPPSSPPRGATSSSQVQSAVTAVQAPAPPPVYKFEKHIARDVYIDLIRKNYPDLDVANLSDFDLVALSSGGYDGSPAGIQQWLQDELDAVAELEGGDVKAILEEATVACNEVVSAIGLKPSIGATDVIIRPVTGTDYSMRLWPASEQSWCFDFVHSTTQEQKNKPFQFELWAVPLETDNQAPWLPISLLSRRLYSMEFGFGLTDAEIKEGEEKFALMDGQTCILKRLGHRDIRFTVPNRNPVVVHDEVEVVVFR